MFYFAQKAVLHPSAPLWNYQETLKISNYNKIYLELIFLFLLFFIWASLNLFYLLLRDIFTGFVQEKDLTDSCKKALGLIFKICDMDNDGIMCDAGITLLYYIYTGLELQIVAFFILSENLPKLYRFQDIHPK